MRSRHIAAVLGALLALGMFAGCGKKELLGTLTPNKPPKIEITCGAVTSDKSNPLREPYTIHFCWTAFDPDGFVDHFEYANSPADTGVTDSARAHRVSTKLHESTIKFPADSSALVPGDSGGVKAYPFERLNEFFVRAVDNEGRASEWAHNYFNALTIAPTSFLDFPTGQNGVVGPSMTARWHGRDLDSSDPKRLPVKFHVFFKDVTGRPAVLGTADAADLMRATMSQPPGPGRNFIVGGDTISWVFKLTSNHQYCLVVKSIDEAGAEDPVPTLVTGPAADLINERSTNAAFFTSMPGGARPTLLISAGSITKTFNGYDPSTLLPIQVPPKVDLSFAWVGDASGYGGQIVNYSYALDIDDPTAAVPVVTQPGGFTWTAPDARATSAILPGFPEKGIHYFFVRVTDDAGSYTIGVVQIEVIPVSFDRPLLLIVDIPNLPQGRASGTGFTAPETIAFWRDILETDRYWVDFRDDPAGKCAPLAQGDSVLGFYDKVTQRNGLTLSVLSHFRSLVWFVPQPKISSGFDYELRQLVISATVSNNLYTYLSAGGNVWAFGGGFAEWLIGEKGSGRQPTYPFFWNTTNESDENYKFYFDVLGLRGAGDTLFSTKPVGHVGTPTDSRMRGMDPWPVPFVRQVYSGAKELRQMPTLSYDLGRLDTMPTGADGRYDPSNGVPYSGVNEVLRGFPREYSPGSDSSTWQPIGLYRAVGREGSLNIGGTSDGPFVLVDSSICAWYKRGTTLTVLGRGHTEKVRAAYQLFYFGFDLTLMQREQVRQVADVILSTQGWNIWRGTCPTSGAKITRARMHELQDNASRITAFRQLSSGGRARQRAVAPVLPQNRRR